MMWCNEKKGGSLTANHKVKFYYNLPEFSTIETVAWNCHVDAFSKLRYGMILGRDLLIALVSYFKYYYHVIKGGDVLFKSYTTTMVELFTYYF